MFHIYFYKHTTSRNNQIATFQTQRALLTECYGLLYLMTTYKFTKVAYTNSILNINSSVRCIENAKHDLFIYLA